MSFEFLLMLGVVIPILVSYYLSLRAEAKREKRRLADRKENPGS